MKTYKKLNKKTQKIYNMKGCSLEKCKIGCKKYNCPFKKGGAKTRRFKKALAYPAVSTQAAFAKNFLAYTGQNGGQNPNLPYGQTPPMNYPFPKGVVNEDVIYGPTNTYGGKKKQKKGGMCNNGKYPDGLVGLPWGANNYQLPGVDGISGDRNYLKYNNNNYNPLTEGVVNGRALYGGKKEKKHRRTQKAGNVSSLFPQDLVNMTRQATYGLGSIYNAYLGYPAPVNPLPYKDQGIIHQM